MTATCPAEQDLSALLAGTLPDDSLDTLESHLTDCVDCRRRLDDLSNSPHLESWLSDARAAHPFPYLSPLWPTDAAESLGRIGRYLIESEFGRGGMGVVFRGIDTELKRPVAVKVLRIGRDDAHGVERFLREARAAAAVRHDHLVPVLDVVRTDDGRPGLVMPLVFGPTLRDWFHRDGPKPIRRVADLVRQVADGLSAVHGVGLVHRDVKPGNVLLEGPSGRAMLTDFGLSRDLAPGETLTQDGMLVGTPEYVSPEQATDPTACDARSDVYSLGVTLYEGLAGVPPFRGRPFDVIHAHRTVEPVAVRRLVPTVPADLETIVSTCLAKRPERRYASAAALRDDLANWLAGKPIRARPAGRVERTVKWVRRNPWPVAVVAVSVIGAVAAGLGWWRATEQTNRANAREQDAIAAGKRADASRQIADDRSLLALGAINTLITKSQTLLGDAPGTLALKKQLNEQALADLRQLTAAVESVPGAERATVAAHLKLGDTFNLLGQSDDALGQWAKAIDAAERRLADHPDDILTARDLARAHYATGFTRNRLADPAAATRHFDVSVLTLEALHGQLPDDDAIAESLSVAYNGRADVDWYAGNAALALAGYGRSAAVLAMLAAKSPSNRDVKSKQLFTFGRIGYVNAHLVHDYAAAERGFRGQLAVARAQLANTPDDPTWRRNANVTALDLAGALYRQCRFDEAVALLEPARVDLAAVAAADPDNGLARRDLAIALGTRGNVACASGDAAAAERWHRQSLAELDAVAAKASRVALVSNDLAPTCFGLMVACERQGKYDEAAAWMDRWARHAQAHHGPNPADPKIRSVLELGEAIGDALRALPATFEDPARLERLSPRARAYALGLRGLAWARAGEFALAERELEAMRPLLPGKGFAGLYEACLFGERAAAERDPTAKAEWLRRGRASLFAAIRADRTTLESLLFASELVPIRREPGFADELIALVRTLN